ncbi:phenazine biosynthesis-like domain-containing protein [Caerostris extrusa]|uniref:Phenazine biosynthesis-like domain-containing protein n=1 Tax=Caerostris extrusa TaxID=172846 RepID=A0AAV4P1Y0_CAEEX|nr:phenazine biosynthesis-like domain-containing protein [Caerostris extrusa]
MADLHSKKLPLYIADAFTKHPFAGNSAAVCLLPYKYDLENDKKQKIAAEMNLSETAFVKIINEGDTFQTGKQFALEWFTPVQQVPLCGHATLASAAVLFKDLKNLSEVLEFETLSGTLKAKKLSNNTIQLDLPAYESHSVKGKYDKIVKIISNNLPVESVMLESSLNRNLLIRLCDSVTRNEFELIQTNDAELLSEPTDICGIIVTMKGLRDDCVDEEGNGYDFISRYFAPWFGISEDPVTGSAHSSLAPFWAPVLGKTTFYARQCSRRGGELHVELVEGRVLLSGGSVVVRMNVTIKWHLSLILPLDDCFKRRDYEWTSLVSDPKVNVCCSELSGAGRIQVKESGSEKGKWTLKPTNSLSRRERKKNVDTSFFFNGRLLCGGLRVSCARRVKHVKNDKLVNSEKENRLKD